MEETTEADRDRRSLPIALVAGVVAIGAAIRLGILLSPLGRPDADEVVVGLMARHLWQDGYPPFLWGQPYGGTIEVLPVAISLRVFGSSIAAMRLPVIGLAAANAVLVWRVARRWLPEAQAQLAGLLLWVAAPAAVWLSVREMLLYTPLVTIGLGLALLACRLRDGGGVRDAVVFGLLAGVGWWTSPTVLYFLVPAVVVAAPRLRRLEGWRLVPAVGVGSVVGVWPWLRYNLASDFASLEVQKTFPVTGTYGERLRHFFTDGLPAVLGFRATFTYEWVLGGVGRAGYLAVLGVLVWGLVRALRRGAWDGLGLLVFPFVFAYIPFVMDDPNLRYLFFIVPIVAVAVARVLVDRRAQVAVLALAIGITGVGLQRMYEVSEVDGSRARIGNVGDLSAAVAVLDREHITAVHADYWVAYRIDFETGERIIAAPSWGIDRYEPYTHQVAASPRSAWVVTIGPQRDALLQALDGLGVSFTAQDAGEFTVVIPDRPVQPREVPDRARYTS